jgi:hypothetical protein
MGGQAALGAQFGVTPTSASINPCRACPRLDLCSRLRASCAIRTCTVTTTCRVLGVFSTHHAVENRAMPVDKPRVGRANVTVPLPESGHPQEDEPRLGARRRIAERAETSL